MTLLLASISPRSRPKSTPCESLAHEYILRSTRFSPTEAKSFPSENALLAFLDTPGKTSPTLVLCDSSGSLLTSLAVAEFIRRHAQTATPRLVFAIGPPDGWSPAALARAGKLISFGRITLPHELARVILAEQIYRALTLLAGHPYHSGH